MFKVIQATSAFMPQGFQITFDNGYMVSTMFGRGNYCANRKMGDYSIPPNECVTAEVAVFFGSRSQPEDLAEILGKDKPDSSDTYIAGWTTPDALAIIIAKVAALPRPL